MSSSTIDRYVQIQLINLTKYNNLSSCLLLLSAMPTKCIIYTSSGSKLHQREVLSLKLISLTKIAPNYKIIYKKSTTTFLLVLPIYMYNFNGCNKTFFLDSLLKHLQFIHPQTFTKQITEFQIFQPHLHPLTTVKT